MINVPTKITILRILLIPIFVVVFLVEFDYHNTVACAIFLLASVTDAVDGHLARKNNQITDLGKFLDPIADKLLVASALVLLCYRSAATIDALQICLVVFVIAILSREFAVSAFRTIAASKSMILAADYLGKIKTVLQMAAIVVLLIAPEFFAISEVVGNSVYYVGFAFLALATLMTIISGVNYFVKNKQVLQ